MYGSSFHLEQAINTKRISTIDLQNSISAPKSEKKKSFMIAGLITLMLTISAASFAGPSTPRLPGGNGNANGR